MEVTFYIAAAVAVLTTLRVITHSHPVHALLYLIASLLAVAVVFFTLGAPFAAVLEVIVYAGAIVVLFVFVVMMLKVDRSTVAQERQWLDPTGWIGPGVAAAVLLAAMMYALWGSQAVGGISGQVLGAKEVGIALFGPYLLLVELASFLLLAALVIAAHVGRD
ncbi:MAG: NADH-quinone oxidoreductase subunit J [Salinisphaera sp.]|nr:NADH-quinone oxidoreductase subunit J [Salinisphaera sp.]